MFLFGASSQARRGMGAEAVEYLTKARDLVSSTTGIPFSAWAGVGGLPLGTFFLSSRIESFEQYMAANLAVTQSADYHAHLKTGVDVMEGPTETFMSQVMATAGDIGDEPAPLIVITTAAAAAGKQVEAVTWGIDMLNYGTEVTGTPSMFTVAVVGNFAEMSWIQGHADGAALDASYNALTTDPGYLEKLGTAGDLFAAGSGRRMVMAQLP